MSTQANLICGLSTSSTCLYLQGKFVLTLIISSQCLWHERIAEFSLATRCRENAGRTGTSRGTAAEGSPEKGARDLEDVGTFFRSPARDFPDVSGHTGVHLQEHIPNELLSDLPIVATAGGVLCALTSSPSEDPPPADGLGVNRMLTHEASHSSS